VLPTGRPHGQLVIAYRSQGAARGASLTPAPTGAPACGRTIRVFL